jgi:hypothetical protein
MPMRYQSAYLWLTFLSALDIMLTWIVLFRGGQEVNALADAVIRRFDITGLVVFKFALIVLVILICEVVGRRSDSAGRRMANWCVALGCVPVALAFLMLLSHR